MKSHPIARLRIGALGVAARLVPTRRPLMLTGPGSARKLCRQIADTGVPAVMVVTDGLLVRLGIVEPLVRTLSEHGVRAEVFADVLPDPSLDVVLAGARRLAECGARAVLAVGGGSPIDAAKAIVACHANDCRPERLVGYFKVRRFDVPLYAIPTTAGTGSEVTVASIISDPVGKRKLAIVDPKLVPAAIALDPELMAGLPPPVTAATGMDALTHAVESYLSTMATAETRSLSRFAARTILRDLGAAYDDGRDLAVRERMAVAACAAGLAFTRASVGYVHAVAHQLGALYHVPHGLANAVVLPRVLDFYLDAAAAPLAQLADACGIGRADAGERARAEAFVAEIRRMNARLGIPETIETMNRADVPEIARRALAEAHGTYPVPKYMSRAECEALVADLVPA